MATLAAEYSEAESRSFAAMSAASYCISHKVVEDWDCAVCKEANKPLEPGKIRVFHGGVLDAQKVIVGRLQDQDGCVAIFRGTRNTANVARDLEAWHTEPVDFKDCDGCEVDYGFYTIWQNLRDPVLQGLKDVGCEASSGAPLYITGHSLGGALALLAMFDLHTVGYEIATSYVFESPRVGNTQFADAFRTKFGDDSRVFRITHYMDPVPHLPAPLPLLDYVHVMTEVYYDKAGKYKVCQGREDPTCSDQFTNIPELVALHVLDHCKTPLLKGGDFCLPDCLPADEAVLV
eukprot:TRINITY_DN122702_c0_g1_i1.p1 TRINITY_DN122702_c0_g1~~TRINITY_DN122702_c0_g1_i1.p1  ORF type:complete len:330 (+),score=37.96 TRINITY_DN122702_c0_g1_i1:123-992(+)